MKIKHYAGYGTVEIKRINTTKFDGRKAITVAVYGNHEYGLLRPFYDPWCIHNWIGKKFAKGKTYTDLIDYRVLEHDYARDDIKGIDVEYAIYRLVYKED